MKKMKARLILQEVKESWKKSETALSPMISLSKLFRNCFAVNLVEQSFPIFFNEKQKVTTEKMSSEFREKSTLGRNLLIALQGLLQLRALSLAPVKRELRHYLQ